MNDCKGFEQLWLISGLGGRPAEARMVMELKPEEVMVDLAGVSFAGLVFELISFDITSIVQ